MADIPAATVMKLRKMSGQGMMDCKNALAETDGAPSGARTTALIIRPHARTSRRSLPTVAGYYEVRSGSGAGVSTTGGVVSCHSSGTPSGSSIAAYRICSSKGFSPRLR